MTGTNFSEYGSFRMSFRRDNGGVPDRWLKCPRKAEAFIAEKFLVFKTPLSSDYNDDVPIQYRFPPKMIFDFMKTKKVRANHNLFLMESDQ